MASKGEAEHWRADRRGDPGGRLDGNSRLRGGPVSRADVAKVRLVASTDIPSANGGYGALTPARREKCRGLP